MGHDFLNLFRYVIRTIREAGTAFIAGLLTVILLCGNLTACGREAPRSVPDKRAAGDERFVELAPDDFWGITAIDREFIASEIMDDVFIEMIDDGFIDLLADKYHADIDDIFISLITIDEYDDLIDTIDPQRKLDIAQIVTDEPQRELDIGQIVADEPQRELDIRQIVADVAIGAVVVLVCIALSVVPGVPQTVATLLVAAPKAALIGAATDAAISGVISYVKTDGSTKDVLYDSIEAGASGFKYGAIFTAGAAAGAPVVNKIRIAREAKRLGNKSAARNVTFSEAPGIRSTAVIQTENVARMGMSGDNFIAAYGKELLDDIYTYSGSQHSRLNAIARGEKLKTSWGYVNKIKLSGNDYLEALGRRLERINNFLNTQTIKTSTTFIRCENMPGSAVSNLYNISSIEGKNPIEIARLIKNQGRVSNSPSLTSTFLPSVNEHTRNGYLINGWGNADLNRRNNIKILRELVGEPGTKGFNISQFSRYKEHEFLMPQGLTTEVIDVRVEKILFEGEKYDVIRVIEKIVN